MRFLNNLDLNKNELQNVRAQNLSTPPSTPLEGMFYYNSTDDNFWIYTGDEVGKGWKSALYVLPTASNTLGGIKAAPKAGTDTVEVKIGTDEKLYVPTYPDVTLVGNTAETNKYISSATVAGHKITFSKGTLPTNHVEHMQLKGWQETHPIDTNNSPYYNITDKKVYSWDGSNHIWVNSPHEGFIYKWITSYYKLTAGTGLTLIGDIPKASENTRGGIKATTREEEIDTVEVKIGTDDKLYVKAYPDIPDITLVGGAGENNKYIRSASVNGHKITFFKQELPSETDPIFTGWDKSTGISITKSQVSDFAHTHVKADITDFAHDHDVRYYTKEDANTLLNTKLNTSLKGSNNGLAELGSDGKVPSSQLPSYVDDVLEYTNLTTFPVAGESGKIYVALDTNKTYRWSGSGYIEISASLTLGETSSTAYAGNKGKAVTDDLASHKSNKSNPHEVTKAQVGLGNVNNTSDANKPVSTAQQAALDNKVDKVANKGLSTNDYTTTEKNKLAGIASGAEVNVQSDWDATSGDAFIQNKPYIPGKYFANITLSDVNGTMLVEHGLGTKNVIVSLRDSDDEFVYCNVKATTANQIQIKTANVAVGTVFQVTIIG